MDTTPKGNRLHIALLGRTNVGKSSFLNLVVGQDIAITSSVAGTTTDVVEKAMELLPLGPVLFLDTAGLDDASELSALRLKKTEKIFDRADIALLVTEPDVWGTYEEEVLAEMDKRRVPVIVVVNKIDLHRPSDSFLQNLKAKVSHVIPVSSLDTAGRNAFLDTLKRRLLEAAPDDFVQPPSLVGDLLPPGGLAVLVVPIDLQAPRGRLILPQVQTIRDALDNDAAVLVVKERELPATLALLNRPPDIVICDSQVILKVSADVAPAIPLTTFSILFARQKGDLATAAEGVAYIENLQSGDKVLIAEACSHHPLEDDIGRVKIPRWLKQYAGGNIQTDISAGRDYPENLREYKLIIHCGACMLTRREMLGRQQQAREAEVPVTNYGLAISFTQGVVRRTLSPFPSALLAFDRKIKELHPP
ncbi:MAG: GTPase Era [Syntrophus sp. PtaU1.Bin005]|jgi:[FeFe] hydrogenase H-cluster maturation GTPase HydF|uniref:[FeFe] hydrogenase H-cluster maturation GTPase HydF n=1 Tax=Syntrophus buswellii TaxID=43774 RepID=UPI0009CE2720|nr:MAG: GTPase Era [Syntrophus sp. PtaB.Bin138]OPY83628.1 MAG: GTPase Era [Syntrophus sp. PtaU1.Bin005]